MLFSKLVRCVWGAAVSCLSDSAATHSFLIKTQEECLYDSAQNSLKNGNFSVPLLSCGTTVVYMDCHTTVYLNMHYTFITHGESLSLNNPVQSHPHWLFHHLSPASPSMPGRHGPSALSPQKAKQAWCQTGYPERSLGNALIFRKPSRSFGLLWRTPIMVVHNQTSLLMALCRQDPGSWSFSVLGGMASGWQPALPAMELNGPLGCAHYQDTGPIKGLLRSSLPKGSTFACHCGTGFRLEVIGRLNILPTAETRWSDNMKSNIDFQ